MSKWHFDRQLGLQSALVGRITHDELLVMSGAGECPAAASPANVTVSCFRKVGRQLEFHCSWIAIHPRGAPFEGRLKLVTPQSGTVAMNDDGGKS